MTQPESPEAAIRVEALNLRYGSRPVLQDLSLEIPANRVTALIGPSGCGKTTFLRCFNRLNDTVEGCTVSGSVQIFGRDIHAPATDVIDLRRRVGMVFQRPNPFPMSVYDNVAYGLRVHGVRRRRELDEAVEWALRAAALWDEVADDLELPALALSQGQQQRLVIARALAVQPEIILFDEPASALDPISTLRIEELLHELKDDYTLVLVTHNMQQAARVSDHTAFMYEGRILEFGETALVFTNPRERETENYITGRYGRYG